MQDFNIISLSESALLIQFGNEINMHLHEQVMLAKEILEGNPFDGFIETVPAYNSLAVYFNPFKIIRGRTSIADTVKKEIELRLTVNHDRPKSSHTQCLITIPVCYDESFGIDLITLSEKLQLSTEELIQLHCSKTYKVYMTGFTPGFPYMGTLDERLFTNRKTSPRTKVEKGAVAIAGNQTGIYPLNSPGGWNIIGRTPMQLFDVSKKIHFF